MSSSSEFAKGEVIGFNDLPIEVISYILEFLPYADLQEAQLVCQRWYAASHSPYILKQKVLVFSESQGSHVVNTLKESCKVISNIFIKGKSIKIKEMEERNSDREQSLFSFWTHWLTFLDDGFWMCYGPKLQSLTLNCCGIIKGQLLKILFLCPELKSIEISECNLESGSQEKVATNKKCLAKLSHLESLKIDGTEIHYLDDRGDLFDCIVSSTTRLKSLSLINCMIEPGPFGTTFLTPEHVLGYIQKNTHSLINISFVHKWHHNELAFSRLLQIPDLQLKSLETNYPIPKEFVHRLKSLRVLKLTGYFQGELSRDIIAQLGNLRCLEIKFCYISSLSSLHVLKNLTSLSIKWVSVSRETGVVADINSLVVEAICSDVNTVLKKLSLSVLVRDCRTKTVIRMRAPTLVALAKTHPALIDLELSWPFDDLEGSLDYAIQAIFKYQSPGPIDNFIQCHPRIERLSLKCLYLSDQTIDVIVRSLPRLKYVEIVTFDHVSVKSNIKLRNHCKSVLFRRPFD